jgi:GNAT superfamily N-acetyltransferase
MPAVIRPARLEDLGALKPLLAQLSGSEPWDDDRRADRTLKQILANPDRLLIVAEQDGELIGSADAVCVANLTRGSRPWVAVENVVVDERGRRQGIGTALLAHLCDWAAERGAYKVQLITGTANVGKLDFYRRAGFEDRSAFRRYL